MGRVEEEQNHYGRFNYTSFNTLKQAYSPFAKRICFSFTIGILGRGLLLANANLVGLWVDSLCKEPQICRPIPSLLRGLSTNDFLLILLVLVSSGFALTWIFRVLFSRVSAMAVSRIYDEVTFRTSAYPMSFFDNTPTGRVVTRFSSDYGNIFRLFGGPLAEFVAIVFDLIIMVILITLASPYYLPIVVVMGFCNFAVYRLNLTQIRDSRRALSASRSPSIAHFAETSQGASAIRTFNKESTFSARFSKLDHFFLRQKLKTFSRLVTFSLQMNSLSAFFLFITGAIAFFLLQKNELSVGSIGVAFGFILLAGTTLQLFFEWLAQFEEGMVGVERLDDYLRKPLEKGVGLNSKATFKTDHPQAPAPISLNRPQSSSLQISNLWFRYHEELPWVLKGINLQVKAGERIGIVGKTGSGKSSLIQALFHLYPIEQGSIQIDGFSPWMDLSLPRADQQVPLQSFRSLISYISQDPVLFRGNLRFNLDPKHSYSDQTLLDVLKQVGFSSWISSSDSPLDWEVAERGKNFSLGERQLICLARTLLQESPIVVMDEATSSVDPQSEEIMIRATEDFFKDKTQIIIAHRLSTLKKCDRILWIQNGEVHKIGSREDVLPQFSISLQ